MSDEPRPTSLSIFLPESQRAWIDEQVAANGYGSPSELVGALITTEQNRRARERLEALLLEGVNSGPGEVITPEYWARLRADLVARGLELRKRKGLS